MSKPSSFISEHSAEFILVSDLMRLLRPEYPFVTPVYYWATREGGINSYDSFFRKAIRVLAFYPRRPKVVRSGSGVIHVKINEILFHRSQYLVSNGIGVIAGIPLADKLDAFHSSTPCLWFEIGQGGIDREFQIEMHTGAQSGEVPRVLSKNDILSIIDHQSQSMSWQTARDILKKMGRSGESFYTLWNRMSGDLYKPVYLLLHLD